MNDAPDNRNLNAEQALLALIETMARLRDPVGGCA